MAGKKGAKKLCREACNDIWINYYSGREVVHQRGLPSMARLAQLYGVSHATIRRIVRGEYKTSTGEIYQGATNVVKVFNKLTTIFIVEVHTAPPCSWAKCGKQYAVIDEGGFYVLSSDKDLNIGARRILRKEHCKMVMEVEG